MTPDHCCLWPACMQKCIGGRTSGVRTNEGVHKGEICVNSHEFTRNSYEIRTNSRDFTPMNRLQPCKVLAPLVSGPVWAWWVLVGRDYHRMMRNDAWARILPPQIPHKEPRIWFFPPKTLKFG